MFNFQSRCNQGIPMADNFQDIFKSLKVEIDPEEVEKSIKTLQDKVKKIANDGRYTKVRLKYRGKVVSPDMPLAVFVAAEAAVFWYAGLLRVLAFNVGVGSILEVEFVHEADGIIDQGKVKYEEGDVEAAEELFKQALEMSPDHAEANYRMAVLLRVMARVEEAIPLFEKVAKGDSEWKEKAEQALDTLRNGRPIKTL